MNLKKESHHKKTILLKNFIYQRGKECLKYLFFFVFLTDKIIMDNELRISSNN